MFHDRRPLTLYGMGSPPSCPFPVLNASISRMLQPARGGPIAARAGAASPRGTDVRTWHTHEPVVAGVSVSVSGPLRRQGQDAYDGIRRGVEEGARTAGFDRVRAVAFDTPIHDAKAFLDAALADSPDLLVVAGRFEDDAAIIRERRMLETVGTVACVAAGAEAFHRELGVLAEGVIGPSQWEPHLYERPSIGPPSAWFGSEFQRVFQRDPGYVAAQAYAMGLIVGECMRRADSLEDRALLAAARELDTTTLYGGFRLDPGTLRQVGPKILLVEWRDGRKHPLPPTGIA